jgi:hypothetical protein
VEPITFGYEETSMLADLLARRRDKNAFHRDTPQNSDRRGFMRGLGVAAAGAAAATALGGRRAEAADLDVAILQFALNLEYLEAEFYSFAAFGHGLPPSETGNSFSTVIGGSQVPFTSPKIAAVAQEIATEENKHVLFLRAALGASVVNEPVIDLKNSFIALGQATGLSNDFNPFANELSFLYGSYIFEDVGVTAYHGAAPLITDKAYLDKAAGILAVEAYHAGLIRMALFELGQGAATLAISKLRAQLDGTYNTINVDDTGVGNVNDPQVVDCSQTYNGTLLGGFPNPDPPGNNAIAYDRTTRQVLNIVYGGVNATSGLFFPNGLNGTITS